MGKHYLRGSICAIRIFTNTTPIHLLPIHGAGFYTAGLIRRIPSDDSLSALTNFEGLRANIDLEVYAVFACFSFIMVCEQCCVRTWDLVPLSAEWVLCWVLSAAPEFHIVWFGHNSSLSIWLRADFINAHPSYQTENCVFKFVYICLLNLLQQN